MDADAPKSEAEVVTTVADKRTSQSRASKKKHAKKPKKNGRKDKKPQPPTAVNEAVAGQTRVSPPSESSEEEPDDAAEAGIEKVAASQPGAPSLSAPQPAESATEAGKEDPSKGASTSPPAGNVQPLAPGATEQLGAQTQPYTSRTTREVSTPGPVTSEDIAAASKKKHGKKRRRKQEDAEATHPGAHEQPTMTSPWSETSPPEARIASGGEQASPKGLQSAAETMPSKTEQAAIESASLKPSPSGGAATSTAPSAGQTAPTLTAPSLTVPAGGSGAPVAVQASSTLKAEPPSPPRRAILKSTGYVSPVPLSPVSEDGSVGLKPGEILVPKDADGAKGGDKEEEEAEVETRCGLFGVYPACLQGYRTAKCALTVLCLVSFTRSFSMNGVMMVVLPSLERRYQLRSYESGMILSSNDVASCIAMLPVSFLATQRHKPRFVGVGIATMGLGNLVISLVHFLSPAYHQSGGLGSDLCPQVQVENACSASGSIRNFRFMIMAGQLMAGLGATPINTVTIAYLDENLPKKKSSLYIGIFNSMAIIGPAVGFMVGGFTLTHYVDITTDISSLGLTNKSPSWIGAWWLGFLMASFMGIIMGVLAGSFPKQLPTYAAVCAEKKADVSAFSVVSMLPTAEFGRRITDMPKAIRRLLTNVPFMLLNLAMSFNNMFTIGITSMMTKFFQSQFGLPSSRVAYLTGPIILVGGGFGAIMGGALVSRWNLDYLGIMRLCMYNCCFSLFGVLSFLFYCPENTYATPEGFVGAPRTMAFDVNCNLQCNCTESTLNPICGADNVVYLSPCMAGCRKEIQIKNVKMYSECVCLNETLVSVPGVSDEQVLLAGAQATRSRCPVDCGLLYPYLLGVFLSLSSTFLNAAPSTAASIRCVKPAERSLALGLKTIIIRIIGSIPAPVIFGSIVDQSCLTWKRSCGSVGNCIAYAKEGMAKSLFYGLLAMLITTMLLFYLSMLAFRRNARLRAERKAGRLGQKRPGSSATTQSKR